MIDPQFCDFQVFVVPQSIVRKNREIGEVRSTSNPSLIVVFIWSRVVFGAKYRWQFVDWELNGRRSNNKG